jgi:hypothetical protein
VAEPNGAAGSDWAAASRVTGSGRTGEQDDLSWDSNAGWDSQAGWQSPASPGPAGHARVRRPGRYQRARSLARYERSRGLVTLDWRVIAAVGGIVLIGLIILIYLLASGSSPSPAHGASAAAHHSAGRTARGRSTAPARSPAPAATRSAAATGPAAGPLQPVSAAAFGPGGTGQGDNPQQAALAISSHPGAGWQTNWYATANFGNLQSGTGLLLNLGSVVTVTGASVDLGAGTGGDLQLRAGDVPTLAALQPVAVANDAHGVLALSLPSPVHVRYLLLWFSRLPADSAGTYQATVYHVAITGYR